MSFTDQEKNIEPDSDSMIFKEQVLQSEMYEEAKKKAQEAVKRQEAEHIIKMTLRAGVPKELIGWNSKAFNSYTQKSLNKELYRPPNLNPNGMAEQVCNIKSGWTRKPLIIFVDGGSKETRIGFSKLILARAIIGNFYHLGKLGVSLPYSMVNLKFNSFDNDRQTFITNLLDIPVVYIEEVCDKTGFKSASDGAVMMDQLLSSRKSPVILSLSTSPELFTGSTTYGNVFRDAIEAIKSTVFNDKYWRFSIRTDKPCLDIMTFNQQFSKKG